MVDASDTLHILAAVGGRVQHRALPPSQYSTPWEPMTHSGRATAVTAALDRNG